MERNALNYEIIKTSSGQVGYVKLGSGAPLIMLVGYSGNLLHWNSELIYALAENFTVYLPDNRLVGESKSTNLPSIAGMAQDIADFILALDLDQANVCGWSMGGIIAQALAMEHESLVVGIALIVSQPDYSYTYGKLHELVTNLRDKPGKENRDKLTELFFSGMPSIEFRKYLAKTILPIKQYVYPFSQEAQGLQNLAVANWQTDIDKLQKITTPVLITTAKNDLVTKPEASNILHNLLVNSRLISYPDGGHFFLHSYPVDLAQQITKFLVLARKVPI